MSTSSMAIEEPMSTATDFKLTHYQCPPSIRRRIGPTRPLRQMYPWTDPGRELTTIGIGVCVDTRTANPWCYSRSLKRGSSSP
jgi:hypothetical protein